MARLATIGVYGFTADGFLGTLSEAGVTVLVDVRRRRGVRGREYAWANSTRLQALLADAGIAYRHHPELAPTDEMRRLQYAEDARAGVRQRSRTELSGAFRRRYAEEILDRAEFTAVMAEVAGARAAALLCVEREPAACHRSLLAARLAADAALTVRHLLPAP